ncbi:MAG: hypothetical protein ABIT83_22005 [Massilia sp.]
MTALIRLVLIAMLAAGFNAQAANAEFPDDVTRWQDISVPPETSRGDRAVWSYAANYSRHEWRVVAEAGQIHAQLKGREQAAKGERPDFTPQADKFRRASAFFAVDDGWLVAFNQGEFGAALYWFSADGQQNYKISDHQVVEFFVLADGIHAIEGLAHGVHLKGMPVGRGSIVRIARPSQDVHWQASSVIPLPGAPFSVAVRRDGSALVTLWDRLVSLGKDGKITTLLADAPWDGMYPNSSVLSADQQKLYIGMRQYVAELDIPTANLRFLLPSPAFLNAIPEKDQQAIRKQADR